MGGRYGLFSTSNGLCSYREAPLAAFWVICRRACSVQSSILLRMREHPTTIDFGVMSCANRGAHSWKYCRSYFWESTPSTGSSTTSIKNCIASLASQSPTFRRSMSRDKTICFAADRLFVIYSIKKSIAQLRRNAHVYPVSWVVLNEFIAILILCVAPNNLAVRLFLSAKRFNFFTMNVNCFPLKCSIAFWCSMWDVNSGEFNKMSYRQNDLLGVWIMISGYSHVFFSGFLIFSISEFSHVVAWRVASVLFYDRII